MNEEMVRFAITVADTLQAAAQALKFQSQEIQDLQRLVSALDTRLDRLEELGRKYAQYSQYANSQYGCDYGEGRLHDPLCQEYDPNAAAESRHGEPK